MGQLFPGVLQHRNAIFCMPVNAPETKNLPGHKNQQQTDKYHDDRGKDWIRVLIWYFIDPIAKLVYLPFKLHVSFVPETDIENTML